MIITEYKSEFKKVRDINIDFELKDSDLNNYNEYYTRVSLEMISDKSKEHLIALYVSADLTIIAAELVSIGTKSLVPFETKEIIRGCLNFKSERVVIIHNHPFSSTASLSDQDKIVHKNVKKELLLYNIELVDSLVIIDSGKYASANTLNINNMTNINKSNYTKLNITNEVIPTNIIIKRLLMSFIQMLLTSSLYLLISLISIGFIIQYNWTIVIILIINVIIFLSINNYLVTYSNDFIKYFNLLFNKNKINGEIKNNDN